jgi:replicative DNA helicase
MDDELIPPSDAEAESRLLGCLLAFPDEFANVAGDLDEMDFYRNEHRILFAGMRELYNEYGTPEALMLDMLGQHLKWRNKSDSCSDMERIGGWPALAGYMANSVRPEVAPAYAHQIRDLRIKRDALRGSQKILHYAANGKPPEDVISEMQTLQDDLTMKLPTTKIETAESIADSVIANILARATSEEETVGIPSGIGSLDLKCNGWRPGQLVVIAGRPGQGKTQLALNLMHLPETRGRNKKHFKTLFFSLEMTNEELVERLFCQMTEMPADLLLKGHVGAFELEKLQLAKQRIADMDLVLLDQTEKLNTVQAIEAQIMARKRAGKMPDLVIVDHLSYLHGKLSKKDVNRNLEIEEIVRGLKALAKRLRIPIVLLSQLSRDVERRQNKRPMLSDLRDSGAIEQEADLVIFIYRHVVYDEETNTPDACELIVAKQRGGAAGTVFCRFDQTTGLFYDVPDATWRPDYTSKNASASPQQNSKTKYKKGGTHADQSQTES